jgi:hypothetical protein
MKISDIKHALRRARQYFPHHRENAKKLARAYLNPPPSGYLIDGAPGWRARGKV